MKQVAQVLAFDIVSKMLLGALSILFIRVMDFNEFTFFVFSLSIATLIGQILSSSFNRIYVIGFKHLKFDKSFWPFLVIQVFMTMFACGIILPFINLPLEILFSIAIFSLTYTLLEASKTVYQQQQRFIRYSVIELMRALLVCVLIIYLIWRMSGKLFAWQALTAHALGMGVVFITVTIILSIRSAKGGELKNGSSALFKNIIIGPYRYLFGYFVILSLFTQLDVLMLWFNAINIELATYGSAFRYYGLLSLVLGAVHVVLLPAVQHAKSGYELREIFKSHQIIIWLFIPVLILSAISAIYILPWVDQGKYPNSVLVFQILCVSALISLAFSPHVNLLMRTHKFKFLFILICLASILNFILNSILIPIYGAEGAAFATAISSAFVTIPIYLHSRQLLNNMSDEKSEEFIS